LVAEVLALLKTSRAFDSRKRARLGNYEERREEWALSWVTPVRIHLQFSTEMEHQLRWLA
jgi:hypothetical protein